MAEELDLPQHVLRFWETRFAQIKPMKRGGGRRYYRPEDVDLLRGIRHLLYGEGYTIRGVQRIFKDHGVRFVQTVWQAGAPQPAKTPSDVEEPESHRPSLILPSTGAVCSASCRSLLAERRRGGTGRAVRASRISGARRAHRRDNGRARTPSPDADGRRFRRARGPAPEAAPPVGGLAREEVRKLQATLAELTECRRLIDAVLQEQAEA